MRVAKRWPEGRAHGNAIPAESRANKVIAVTQTVLAHVRAHQQVGEIPDDTLRRLLGLPERER
jgi:hypothetical protein